MGKFKLIYLIVTSFLFCILPCISAMSPEQRIDKLRIILNAELNMPRDSDMFIVTATRTPTAPGRLPLMSRNEFEQVFKLLRAICVKDFSNKRQFQQPCIGILGRDMYISSTANKIREYSIENDLANSCKLIFFNEMFFSQKEPLTFEQKNFIEDKLIDLSKSSPHSIFYPNFLYTEEKQKTKTKVLHDLVAMGKLAGSEGANVIQNFIPGLGREMQGGSSKMVFENNDYSVLESCANNIAQSISNSENTVNQKYLFNETYAICDGEKLTKTAKVGYFKESDRYIRQGGIYASGTGKTESLSVSEGKKSLQKTLMKYVGGNICLDINIGIKRIISNQMEGKLYDENLLLYFVQSNTIDIHGNLNNRNNLPIMCPIAYADPYYTYYGLQNISIPYINENESLLDLGGQVQEFTARISSDTYGFRVVRTRL